MKGAVAAALFVLVSVVLLSCIGLVMAMPPLTPPLQYEQFVKTKKYLEPVLLTSARR